MANLSIVGSHTVNGVSRLHSDILTKTIFSDFYHYEPHKFTNVTNGIAHRRWLCYSNPELSALLTECIGSGFKKNPEELKNLRKFADDKSVLNQLNTIKKDNKENFAKLIKDRTGIILNTDSLFDVQIKRLHEYKRQLMNAMNIISLYQELKANPDADIVPRTFIFGAKAAPGYRMAKEIIKLIWCLGEEIAKDKKISEKLRVLFIENYCVTMAEALVPAAELSEQISLAGKEASGTGCMKLMINGALTIGTDDGANIEMKAEAGDENMFTFGLTAEEAQYIWAMDYKSSKYYHENQILQNVVNSLSAGYNGESFSHIAEYLLHADPFMCMADFESYRKTQKHVDKVYLDREAWNKKSLYNIAGAGKFAADRSIMEYADRIWHIERLNGKN
jgi:starch phosphorylase